MNDEEKNASAIALKYNHGTATAPTIVAKGKGDIAQQILALANEHEIHVHQSPELLEVLIRLEIGEEIPEALYKAIAEVIAFAYKLKNKS
ncbi:EscU/YscU/HrcU family type III secretion system export apparatus switch protein [Neptunomonas japonica]|uniref:Flagellar biosynthetic protein FlhB n=1 Tax=Neptunomonas japonica JAMM 1380 TaxID=1441457 RepID=A0A7R6PSI2_9GAMM|nr:EscU/YscU/HrcU family type III secretion system export apparatus switch protein [Neptunomonas japonica]BBB28693.1 flagellar biosynthesis protein [Neptunomonas japonica JAMM 1380]